MSNMLDVIIIGAGISGINAAYRIHSQPAPNKTTYAILEARHCIGGTWDLFRYPGIRSDSDMFTFGLEWSPWPRPETLAAGADIRHYLQQSADSAGISQHIRYNHRVVAANWVAADGCWELTVRVAKDGEVGEDTVLRSRFLLLGTGYYDYEQPLEAHIPGLADFKGKVIHPQFWPEDYDYTGKDVVVIGSGATAVTIAPSMAPRARHVTMLQRSPTYIYPVPRFGAFAALLGILLPAALLGILLPAALARQLNRLLWILRGYLMVFFCRTFPGVAKSAIRRKNLTLLPPDVAWDPHFKPRYNPWEQRLCASQDGDFFAAMRSGKVSVATDTIAAVTATEIKLASGAVLHPDVIITATGLKLKFGGGIRFTKDGVPFDVSQKFVWKSTMIQDLPNLFLFVGYENASWTLGADCAAHLLVRLMAELRSKSATVAVPHVEDPAAMEARPLLSLSSTYIRRNAGSLPKAGTGVWRPRSHYLADMYAARWGDIKTGLLIK
ncbi:hypothetical protein HIM_07485 [Hirsutella minnesotensis 3608]|uniref:FAD-containing monooxygenase EthA n=1 Tax=Hirsutella minnesotensis 3608 TaxID=1043627 RepID=A0A0F7ZHR5_9HYPO|nr:hypothetical protein HIM_07485 [Hirsutella minnesotensis 3608]